HFILVHDGAQRLALRAGEACHDDIGLVLENQPPRQRLELAVVRLRVRSDEVDLPAQDTLVSRLLQILIGLIPYDSILRRRLPPVDDGGAAPQFGMLRWWLGGHFGKHAGTAWALQPAFERKSVVDLLDRQLRPVP